jgi:hypothetical protein
VEAQAGAEIEAARAREAVLNQYAEVSAHADRVVGPELDDAYQSALRGRRRLDAIAAQIESAVAKQHALALSHGKAARLRVLTPSYQAPPGTRGGIQAVGYGPKPQEPPPPPTPPYPINDVIAEATDLDGNHVFLRRGYYDATKDRGFGWDKAYWKHGVVNPSVFKDLISHSRPASNKDGRVHL